MNANTEEGILVQNGIGSIAIDRCEVLTMYKNGIHLSNYILSATINKCMLNQNGTLTTHANIYARTYITTLRITNCYLREAGDADSKAVPVYANGINVEGVAITLNGNVFEKHAVGISVLGAQRCRGISVQANQIEWVTNTAIRIGDDTSTPSGVTVADNWIDLTKATYGVDLRYCDAVVVEANHFEDESGHAATACIYAYTNTTNCRFGPDKVYSTGTAPTYLIEHATASNNIVTQDGYMMIGKKKHFHGTAAPSTGTWAVGDIVYNTAPSAGASIGWTCVTAGTPGTWKTFGTIAS
jgi:hypothetical protein